MVLGDPLREGCLVPTRSQTQRLRSTDFPLRLLLLCLLLWCYVRLEILEGIAAAEERRNTRRQHRKCEDRDCKTLPDCMTSPLRFSRLDLLLDFPRAYKDVQIGFLLPMGSGNLLTWNTSRQVK